MTGNISFSPYLQNNASGSFTVTDDGLVQGIAMDDPATRYRLRGAVLNTPETLPMWGGVGIYTDVPTNQGLVPNQTLGGYAGRATLLTGSFPLLGFSVFDQNYSAIQTPQSSVPLVASGATFNYYPLGCLARVAVKCDPVLADLEGGLTNAQVSWDFTNQLLIPFAPAHGALAISAITWAANVASVTVAVNTLVTGDDVVISGSNVAAYNGTWDDITVVDTTHFTFALPLGADPGAANAGQVDAGGGALPCSILGINIGNSMTVDYDPTTGFATWDRSGSCALIQLT